MQNRRWGRRLVVAAIWAIAMSTWGSIGHHLFGLPDLGPLLAVIAVVVVLAWPPPTLRRPEMGPASVPAEQARPSRA